MMKISKNTQIILIAILLAGVMIFFGYLSSDVGVLGNMILFASVELFIVAVFLKYQAHKEIREMEEKFPVFVRDLQENIRSGMSLSEAIYNLKKIDYGRLSKEVESMANKISWGIPVEKVLTEFAKKVKSRRIAGSVEIIKEAYLLGGDLVSTLDSVVNNLRMLEEAEKEKRSIINQYVLVIYAITLIFIVIIVSINRLIMPMFLSTLVEVPELGIQNPCNTCVDLSCYICSLYESTSSNLFSVDPTSPSSYYLSLFFYMAVIQAFFAGLVVGQITENSYIAGLKHSTIMLGITIATFSVMVRLGVLL